MRKKARQSTLAGRTASTRRNNDSTLGVESQTVPPTSGRPRRSYFYSHSQLCRFISERSIQFSLAPLAVLSGLRWYLWHGLSAVEPCPPSFRLSLRLSSCGSS